MNWASDLVRLSLGALIAVVALFAVSGLVALFGEGCGPSPLTEDLSKLRQIVGFAFLDGVPVRDGVFDPYEFVRRGEIGDANLRLFRSGRSGTGPSDDEIGRGDYANFPWERGRVDHGLEGPVFLLLWEKTPDRHGGRLVALSDGSARYCEAVDFALRRLVGLVAQTGRLPMKDGAFDPYEFVREGLLPSDLVRPATDNEIARGEYANFPWERHRGDGKLEGRPFPLLWEKKPNAEGRTVVARSDGTVTSR